jgi:hypothetical protein
MRPVLAGVGDWTEAALLDALMAAIAERGMKKRPGALPLRVAISARRPPPGAIEIAYLLGRDETLRRSSGPSKPRKRMIFPDYRRSVLNVACSVLKLFGAEPLHDTLPEIDGMRARPMWRWSFWTAWGVDALSMLPRTPFSGAVRRRR